jgi:hypothetical protein
MDTGYQWAGSPGFCGSCHSTERVQRTWQLMHIAGQAIEAAAQFGGVKQ